MADEMCHRGERQVEKLKDEVFLSPWDDKGAQCRRSSGCRATVASE